MLDVDKHLTLRLMHLVAVNLCGSGISSTTEEGTLCLFRPVYDKPSTTTFGMTSAVHVFQRGNCFRRVYCIEQYDERNVLAKFNVTLADENNITLGIWHLDISHGLHTHQIENGKKDNVHIPFTGDLVEMLGQIASEIKKGI